MSTVLTITATVTDAAGQVATASVTVDVGEPAHAVRPGGGDRT